MIANFKVFNKLENGSLKPTKSPETCGYIRSRPFSTVLSRFSGERKALDTVESFDFHEGTWTDVSPLKKARRNVAVVVLEGILYAVGGIDEDNMDLASMERFSFHTGKWERVAPLSKCRGEFRQALKISPVLYHSEVK